MSALLYQTKWTWECEVLTILGTSQNRKTSSRELEFFPADISLFSLVCLCDQWEKESIPEGRYHSCEQDHRYPAYCTITTEKLFCIPKCINHVHKGSLDKTGSKKLNSSKLLSTCPLGFLRFLLDLVHGWETTVKREGFFMYCHAALKNHLNHTVISHSF